MAGRVYLATGAATATGAGATAIFATGAATATGAWKVGND